MSEWKSWFCFWTLGALNNVAYVVILCGAKSLATNDFDGAKSLIGVINWALVAMGLFARAANAFFMEDISTRTRTVAICTGFLIGNLLLVLSPMTGSFWCAIGAIIVIGGACSFGESVMLGYLKTFPISMTGAWSSGTGMAGIGGSGWYLLLSSLALPDTTIFAMMLVTVPLYWIAFNTISIGDRRQLELPTNSSTSVVNIPYTSLLPSSTECEDPVPVLTSVVEPIKDVPSSVLPSVAQDLESRVESTKDGEIESLNFPASSNKSTAKETVYKRTLRCLHLVLWYGVHLMFVYMFEYVISVGAAEAAEGPSDETSKSDEFWIRHSYQIFGFCYQAGVLVSRSSLSCLKIKKIWVLTLLQGVSFVVWIMQDIWYDNFMPIWLQFVFMFYVGLLGGAMYVNVFALLIEDPRIPAEDMEFCINMVCIFVNLGIVAASVFDIVMDATFIDA